jgi:hypothetical protein
MSKITIEVQTKCTVWQIAKCCIEESELESLKAIVEASLDGDDMALVEVLDKCDAEYDFQYEGIDQLPLAENGNRPTVVLNIGGKDISVNGSYE